MPLKSKAQPPLRTKEKVHICRSTTEKEEVGEDVQHAPYAKSCHKSDGESRCHDHDLELVSGPNPVDPEIFSSLRRATVRTLSGEQLPRPLEQGPLWFGDPSNGYTIAYLFRLRDDSARGRVRNYALLALAGNNTQRAFEACTLIWTLFEQIASHIVQKATEVRERFEQDLRSQNHAHLTPVSRLLARQVLDPDGVPRYSSANQKPISIAELVDNENIF